MEFHVNELPHSWVNRLSFLLRKELAQRFAGVGEDIVAEEWAVLLLLWDGDGQTPGELAARTIRDRTTMTRLLDGMVKKSLVMRATDRRDRRKSRILLSRKGLVIRDILIPVAQKLVAQSLYDVPPEDVKTCVRVLSKMMTNLQGDSP